MDSAFSFFLALSMIKNRSRSSSGKVNCSFTFFNFFSFTIKYLNYLDGAWFVYGSSLLLLFQKSDEPEEIDIVN